MQVHLDFEPWQLAIFCRITDAEIEIDSFARQALIKDHNYLD
jgi:hypothetical protein